MSATGLSNAGTSDDPTQVLAHIEAAVACLPVTVMPIPSEAEHRNDTHPTARIFVAHQGRGQRWYQQGGRTQRLRTEPRMIEVYEKGLAFDHCQWSGEAGRCVAIEFIDKDIDTLTGGELPSLALRTQHELFDERISRTTLEIAEEALQGLPNGRLYIQGLCLSLVGLLANQYTTGSSLDCSVHAMRLGAARERLIVDMIQEELASDLSLTRLSQAVGLSANHFTRLFRASFGVTPHQYVRQRRMEAAVEALRRDGSLSIAEIALAHGFASQSHMTDVMRRSLGVTPHLLRLHSKYG